MQIRTQLALLVLVALGWGAGSAVAVRPVVDDRPLARANLRVLEERLARDPSDVITARELSERYRRLGMNQLVADTIARCNTNVQTDAQIALCAGRAQLALGNLRAAAAQVDGALIRCQGFTGELAVAVGCGVHTQTELAIESSVIDRLIQWNVDPRRDPDRVELARSLALRPTHFAHIGP